MSNLSTLRTCCAFHVLPNEVHSCRCPHGTCHSGVLDCAVVVPSVICLPLLTVTFFMDRTCVCSVHKRRNTFLHNTFCEILVATFFRVPSFASYYTTHPVDGHKDGWFCILKKNVFEILQFLDSGRFVLFWNLAVTFFRVDLPPVLIPNREFAD